MTITKKIFLISEKLGLFSICGMAISMTFSRALFNVFALLLLSSWLMARKYRLWPKEVTQIPLVMSSVLMFAWIALGLIYSRAPIEEAWPHASTYHKLLLIPLIVSFLDSRENLKMAWISIGVGLLVLQLAYLADIWFDFHFTNSSKTGSIGVFNNYIVEGLSLTALCLITTAGGLLFWRQRPRYACAFLALGGLAFYTVIFLNPGRGAQLALISGLLVMAFFALPPKTRWPGLLVVSMALGLFASQSELLITRFETALTEAKAVETEKVTSVGLRLNAWNVGLELWAEKPLAGQGTGSYEYLMHTEKSERVGGCALNPLCLQPHSQYVLLMVEQGIVGLLLFFLMLAALIRPTFKSQHISAKLAATFACSFAVHSAFDSGLKMGGQMFIFVMLASVLAASVRLDQQSSNNLPIKMPR